MKKLLIATMAAVSVGLCVKAEDTGFISTSFEDIEAGGELPDDLGYFNWPSEADDALFVVSNLTAFADKEKGSRPDYWATAVDRVALTIDTSTPLCCDVSSNDTAYQLSEGDLFFDSVVQFTATDVIAELDSRDKLRVWLYSSSDDVSTETPGSFGETSPKTCLVVTAGKYDGVLSTSNLEAEHYEVQIDGVELQPDTWHRLTIKAIADIDPTEFATPGFEIWVDGKPVTYGAKTQFPSLKKAVTSGNETLQCVAFDGKGAVDDIVFTTTAPIFAREPEEPTVETYTLNIAGENFTYQVYTDSEWGDKVTDLTAINTEYKTLWLGITPTENYELESIKLGNQTIALPEYDAGENVYYLDELQISTEDIDNGAEFTLTITMKEKTGGGSGEEPEDPEDPEVPAKPTIGGADVDTAGAFIAAANSGVTIKVPTEWTLVDNTLMDADGKEYATFADYYNVTLASDGTGTITLELNDKAKPEIDETAADKGDAIVVTETEVALGVTNAKKGLWYGAQAYSDAACTTKIGEEPTDWEQAKDTTVTVTATKPDGDKAFFKVVVTDIAPKSTEE